MELNKIYGEDCLNGLAIMPDKSTNCCVTSPPYYGLRDYGVDGQIGLEETPEQYVEKLVNIFCEVKRVLKDDGTLWLNLGDSYANPSKPGGGDPTIKKRNIGNSEYRPNMPEGLKPKDLIGIPWMVAFALRADGWYLRQDIIWHKPNPMPESVTDRCTKAHEYIFLLSKSKKYYYDGISIKENTVTFDNIERDRESTRLNNTPGRKKMGGLVNNNYEIRNKRSVWSIESTGNRERECLDIIKSHLSPEEKWCAIKEMMGGSQSDVWRVTTKPFKEAHFATFPEDLIVDMIKAGCPEGGVVLDPFMGAGTTALVSKKLKRSYIGFELNPDYIAIANKRIEDYINNPDGKKKKKVIDISGRSGTSLFDDEQK